MRWSSSDETVAKVGVTGLVSAISAGKATIEVVTVDGGYRKTCFVTVEEGEKPSAPPTVGPTPDAGGSTPTQAAVHRHRTVKLQ